MKYPSALGGEYHKLYMAYKPLPIPRMNVQVQRTTGLSSLALTK